MRGHCGGGGGLGRRRVPSGTAPGAGAVIERFIESGRQFGAQARANPAHDLRVTNTSRELSAQFECEPRVARKLRNKLDNCLSELRQASQFAALSRQPLKCNLGDIFFCMPLSFV